MRVLAVVILCSVAAAQQDRKARALVAQLNSSQVDVREAAEEQLVQLGRTGVLTLIAVLREGVVIDDPDDVLRAMRVARVLARLGGDAIDALPALDAAIASVVDVPWVQHAAVPAPKASARGTLASELQRARVFVAAAARTSTADLIEDLTTNDPFTRERAALLLGQRGAAARTAVPALVSGLHARRADYGKRFGFGTDAVVRAACARALIRIAPDSPDVSSAYVALLKDEDSTLRREAVMALGRLGERVPANAYFLLPCLADEDPQVVREAVTALGMLGAAAAKAVSDLEHLCGSPDRQIAVRAAASLRQIRGR